MQINPPRTTSVSALACITNPEDRGDIYLESIASVIEWCNELVIVDGGNSTGVRSKINALVDAYNAKNGRQISMKWVLYPWEYDFNWIELPLHLNAGLDECTSDWIVRFDIDYVFRENVDLKLRDVIDRVGDKVALTMQKFSTVLVNRVYQKGPCLMVFRREAKLRFGMALDKPTDLCEPITWDGDLYKTSEFKKVPVGMSIDPKKIERTRCEFVNYDYTFKTQGFTRSEFLRFSRAFERFYGSTKWGHTEEESLSKFVSMMRERLEKCPYNYDVMAHPVYVRERVKAITPEQFGYNGWGLLNGGLQEI